MFVDALSMLLCDENAVHRAQAHGQCARVLVGCALCARPDLLWELLCV